MSCSLHPLPLSLFPPLFLSFLTVSVYLPPLFSLLLSSLLSLFSSAPPSFIPPLSLLNWLLSTCFPLLLLLLLLSIYILPFFFSSFLYSFLLLLKGDISPHRHTCDTKKNQSVTSLSKYVELLPEIDWNIIRFSHIVNPVSSDHHHLLLLHLAIWDHKHVFSLHNIGMYELFIETEAASVVCLKNNRNPIWLFSDVKSSKHFLFAVTYRQVSLDHCDTEENIKTWCFAHVRSGCFEVFKADLWSRHLLPPCWWHGNSCFSVLNQVSATWVV